MSRFLIDLTTSRGYAGKPAVGIVRTEREIARYYWLHHRERSQFVYYDPSDNFIRELESDEVDRILSDGNASRATGTRAKKLVAQRKPLFPKRVRFEDDDVLISCGLLWDHNFLPIIYRAKKAKSLKVVQIVYDVIPMVMPEYTVPGMEQKFSKYIIDVAWTADVIGCISDSTRNDFENIISKISTPSPDAFVFRLGSDLRGDAKRAVTDRLKDLLEKPFVVYVSTIEPRKNHQLLFNLWRELAAEMGDDLPVLLFVGRPAWNVSDLMTYIDRCAPLSDKLRVLSELSDNELAWLYDHCAFTVYPSLYEGWGLPVDESLARGKVCVASNTSSIPEIGRECLELVEPLDFVAWRSVLTQLIKDPLELQRREALIKSTFRPQTWADSAKSFHSSLKALLPIDDAPLSTVPPDSQRASKPGNRTQQGRV